MDRFACHYTDAIFLKLKTLFIRVFKESSVIKSFTLQKPFAEKTLEELLNFSDQHNRVNRPFNTAYATQGKVPKNALQKEIIW